VISQFESVFLFPFSFFIQKAIFSTTNQKKEEDIPDAEMKSSYRKERVPGERRESETAALRKTTMLKTKTARRSAIGGV
jgi:hypothetical protein